MHFKLEILPHVLSKISRTCISAIFQNLTYTIQTRGENGGHDNHPEQRQPFTTTCTYCPYGTISHICHCKFKWNGKMTIFFFHSRLYVFAFITWNNGCSHGQNWAWGQGVWRDGYYPQWSKGSVDVLPGLHVCCTGPQWHSQLNKT